MNIKLHHALLLTLALPLLGACQPSPPPAPPASPSKGTASADAPQTAIGRTVEKAIVEAREELRSKNISISDGMHINVNGHEFKHDDNLPKAEITPQGDLLIEGKQVAVDAAQRKLLLDYRNHIIAIAEAGMAIGIKGADLAGKAVGEAIGAIFGGDEKALEARMEAEGKKIEADAMKLCAQLPPMLATQQQLAAALPAFKPYANMTQEDIEDCGKDDHNDATRAQIRDKVRAEIRKTVRESVRDSTQAAVDTDSAERKPTPRLPRADFHRACRARTPLQFSLRRQPPPSGAMDPAARECGGIQQPGATPSPAARSSRGRHRAPAGFRHTHAWRSPRLSRSR